MSAHFNTICTPQMACDAASAGVKEALCNPPVLALPDLSSPYEVIYDACGVGLGAVLLQDGRPMALEGKGPKGCCWTPRTP